MVHGYNVQKADTRSHFSSKSMKLKINILLVEKTMQYDVGLIAINLMRVYTKNK